MIRSELNKNVKAVIREAEKHNSNKKLYILDLEEKLNNYPIEIILQVMNFIKLVKSNIAVRQDLIEELKNVVILTSPSRIGEIIYELDRLNIEDARVSKEYINLIRKSKCFS